MNPHILHTIGGFENIMIPWPSRLEEIIQRNYKGMLLKTNTSLRIEEERRVVNHLLIKNRPEALGGVLMQYL